MSWEFTEGLAVAAPPNLIIAGTSDNLNSWSLETLLLPFDGNSGINRRNLLMMCFFATTAPSSLQFLREWNISTFFTVSRGGQLVSARIHTQIFVTSAGSSSDSASNPNAQWINPLPFPLRGGDIISTMVPGDANATPVQDWEINCMFGPELKR